MSTSMNDQKSDKSQHIRPIEEKKSGKGTRRLADDDDQKKAQFGKGNPQQKHAGNDPTSFSNKVSETGASDKLAKPHKSDMEDDED
ncbi:MAG TPA: hypothetical protein VE954_31590 [Oligoflexus sp.]|uniref:hypothetical protein n=1 Tax=Oligoflexus sp. TaxID=1971216 RepID=UPI002D43330B|nr:hypothetical protein [Oligoflexus sp.]HYX37668.1 hypothetical protein [Oligoflexus sp.]